MRQTYKFFNQDKNRQFTIYLGPVKKTGRGDIKGQLAGLFWKTLKQQDREKGADIQNEQIHLELYLCGYVTHKQGRNTGYIIYIRMRVL